MADITQTDHTIITHAALTHPAMIEGTPVNVASALSCMITVTVANIEVTANATGVGVIVQGSFHATTDESWFTLAEFTGSTTAAETEAMTATEPVGETVIACASTTNLIVGDIIYIQDTTVPGAGEWCRIVKVVTNTSITIAYGLTTQKDNADVIWTEADVFPLYVNCEGLKRINVLIIHEAATGSNLHVEALAVLATDIE